MACNLIGNLTCEMQARADNTGTIFNECIRKVCTQNPVTFVGVLNECASMFALEEGRCVHE
jgi:hypothetical protein